MIHPDSIIKTEGYGSAHPWASSFNHVWNKHMYKCAACGRSFMRLDSTQKTLHDIIQNTGIPDICTGATNAQQAS